MAAAGTIPQHWLERVKKYEGIDKIAVRKKDLGIWQSYSWSEEYRQVRDFALGLLEAGLKVGDRVLIIGDNDKEYLWAALAIMAAGGTVVGMFTDVGPSEVEYVAAHSDATFAVAGDQEQCDKFLEVAGRLPMLRNVIYWDDRGMWYYKDKMLTDFGSIQQLGRDSGGDLDARFETSINEGLEQAPAMFCYTSGTTGLPKGAMISHANFIYNGQASGQVDNRFDTDNYVSFIPMAWIAGATLEIMPHVLDGAILNFAESPETVRENIREIAPDALFYNARLWETLVATIRARILDSSWFNRKLYDTFLPIGYTYADYAFDKKTPPAGLKAAYQLGNALVFRPLRSQFGLHRARNAYTAGSALSPDVVRFFRALGLPLRQVYGSTEVCAGAVMHRVDDVKFESVGRAIPGSAVKISDEGEILLGGDGLFIGYHKNEEETAESLVYDDDGAAWFKTGDAGHVDDDGHLIYLDRMKDMIELGKRDRYSPQYIEGRLKFSPYISNAMTIGDEARNHVTAMVTIEFENVGRWAEKQGLAYTTFTDLAQKREVYALIRADVEEVNATLPEGARVTRFVLLHKEFDADEGEMTRTRKLRRGFLFDRYEKIIDSLYDGSDGVRVVDTVKYQDGRESTIDKQLRIETIA
jgi:long-chain acyl-CoA synthetase